MKKQTIKQLSFRSSLLLLLLTIVYITAGFGQPQPTSVFTAGLHRPAKLIQLPGGNLFVTETVGPPNSGRISIINREGIRRTLIDGLPSGVAPDGPAGPTGLELRGRTLYVAIGEGDAVLPGPVPGTAIPNPNPSSPLLSSVLAIHFSKKVEMYGQGFSLSFADQMTLANGGAVRLSNGNLDSIMVRMLANFPNTVPNPLPFFGGNVRQSNPFALEVNEDNLYVADAGMNSVVKVDILSGIWRTLTVFPPRPNPLSFGPPVIEAVPTGLFMEGNQLLVTLFTGFPFVPELSEVQQVDTRTGARLSFIPGRSSAIEVLGNNRMYQEEKAQRAERAQRGQRHFVLEFSTNLRANSPGRLLAFDSPVFPQIVATGLISPTGMIRDAESGDIFITEIFTGRIIRVHLNPTIF